MPHPDRGSGVDQPRGWGYAVLPFIEQQVLHDMGSGRTDAEIAAANKARGTTPLPFWNCPSRREARLYAINTAGHFVYTDPYLCDTLSESVQTDYAINGGDNAIGWGPTPEGADNGTATWPSAASATGLVFVHQTYSIATIRNGTSNAYLFGEKSLLPEHYATGKNTATISSIR